jgi:hypothetical protein
MSYILVKGLASSPTARKVMLRELTQLYARRARELSESVARLGRYHDIGPELLELKKDIRQQRSLCDEIAEKLDGYIEQQTRFDRSK